MKKKTEKQLLLEALVESNDLKQSEIAQERDLRERELLLKKEELLRKDRVNISLEEYIRITEENKSLRKTNAHYSSILGKVNIPWNIINANDVEVIEQFDPKEISTIYLIKAKTYGRDCR